MFLPRTDLALESAALSNRKPDEKIIGVDVTEYNSNGINVTKVAITNEEGVKAVGKPVGNYITVECPSLVDANDIFDPEVSKVFSRELAEIIEPYKHKVILVAGLGNRFVTPDSLGPNVSDEINVTTQDDKTKISLCTISPGVLGLTGIETGEIIEAIADKINPDIIIAIDALASRSMHRICTTIQIADTGITPGAGVGNRQKTLNSETMGIPVIAVGVPTVVDAATVTNDAIEHISSAFAKDLPQVPESMRNPEARYGLIKKVLNPYFGELIVTPSQIDCVIKKISTLIADGINSLEHILS